jgi:hypothetical protein
MHETRTCQIDNCTRPYYAKGFCSHHYQKDRLNRINARKEQAAAVLREEQQEVSATAKICVAWGCENPAYGMGVCEKHYYEWDMEGQCGIWERKNSKKARNNKPN